MFFFFDGDPRACISENGVEILGLSELHYKFIDRRLLVFSSFRELEELVRQDSDKLIHLLEFWEEKALFSLEEMEPHRTALEPFFKLYPATLPGLEIFILSSGNSRQRSNKSHSLRFLSESGYSLTESVTPIFDEINFLIRSLKNDLGEEGFLWLSACAIYPEVNWNLTLFLGLHLHDSKGKELFREENLSSLIQLPWFRYGRMPDWLRMELILDMPQEFELQVRDVIYYLFGKASIKPISSFTFQFGKNAEGLILKDLGRRILQLFRTKVSDHSVMKDVIFAGFLNNMLTVKVPNPVQVPADSPKPLQNEWMSQGFMGHPRGLATLFFTEMWERFSYYGMRAILILFMTTEAAQEGLGLDEESAGAIYGLYTAGVYLLTLPGGWLADNILGQRKAIWYGSILIMIGHLLLAIPGVQGIFFLGLCFVAVGTGLLKPNISTIVGDLYPEGGARRDAGFSLFYMGIYIGSLLGQTFVALIGEKVNWHLGFGLAAVGMFFGLLQFRLTQHTLGDIGLRPKAKERDEEGVQTGNVRPGVILGLLLVTILVALQLSGMIDLFTARGLAEAVGVIIVIATLIYFAYILIAGGLTSRQKKKVYVIFFLFVGAALFWAGFEQAGSTLNLFARDYTDRYLFGWELPAGWLQNVNLAFIIIFAPLVGALWVRLAARNLNPSTPLKFGIGLIMMGLGFLVMNYAAQVVTTGVKVGMQWLVFTYFLHTIGELTLSPIGLSAITKLSPKRYVSQMMGIWFIGAALGNLIAGLFAGEFGPDQVQEMPNLFLSVVMFGVGSGILFLIFSPLLTRWMGRVE